MKEIFEPGWSKPQTYWEQIKPTKIGLIVFFALFYLPAIGYQLMLLFLSDESFNLLWFMTPLVFELIISLIVYHFCYFMLKSIFNFIVKTIIKR